MYVKTLPNSLAMAIGAMETIEIESVPCKVRDARDDRTVAMIDKTGFYSFFIGPDNSWIYPLKCETKDNVNHPKHYTSSKARCSHCDFPIECIDVTRHMSFNIGNAFKYLWRHELKGGLEDLKKAQWYINDAIEQLENKQC